MLRLTIIWICLALLVPTLVRAIPATLDLEGPDAMALIQADKERDDVGPDRFAWPHDLSLQPVDGLGWDLLADGSHRWQLDVRAPGSLSLCFGFDRFRLPWGATLHIVGEAGPERVFTAADMQDHGQLWTPVVLGDQASIILTLPAGHRDDHELRLVRVGRGYRYFGEAPGEKQGSCNIDVVCPESVGWEDEIRSVGVYQLGATWKCTGALINNTAQDGHPYFLTANHCDVTSQNAATVVVYWNFESPECGDLGGGLLDDTQTGTTWLAAHAPTDMCLLELNTAPDPDWGVTCAGWDRSTTPAASAVAIHHPSTDEKAISFENEALEPTQYLQYTSDPSYSHWRVVDWDLGTTEPGSSGSPLFNPEHRIVGQLHGGYAACNNDESDWYGRFDLSWDGGGTQETQLSHWLDPVGSNPMSLETIDPNIVDPAPSFVGIDGNPIVQGQASTIQFEVVTAGWVTLKAYDLRGHFLTTLVAANLPAGVHLTPWAGEGLPAGVYVLRLAGPGGDDGLAVTVVR